jgi:hypothetical protein
MGNERGTGASELIRYELAVPRESICYISWTIDAYEGMGFLRTDDPSGLVSVFLPAGWRDDFERLIGAFESEGISVERRGLYVETPREEVFSDFDESNTED